MANSDAAYGLQFSSVGKGFIGRTMEYIKLASMDTAIFRNDVVLGSGGATGSEEATALEPWVKGTPGVTIALGVSLDYAPASTKSRHTVIVDIDQEYHAQDNNDTDGLALADMNKRINVEAGAGNAYTKFSGHELDESTVHASNYKDLLLLRLLNIPDNVFGSHAKVRVRFIALEQHPLT